MTLTLKTSNSIIIPAEFQNRDIKHRLTRFVSWLDQNGLDWTDPNLGAYRDELLERLSPSSVSSHLSTIRGQYQRIIADNSTRDKLFMLAALKGFEKPTEQKAFVDEALTRLTNSINPIHSKVKQIEKQDVSDNDHLRLTVEQANSLIRLPDTSKLSGMRDKSIISLLLVTGIREAELTSLRVADLRQRLNGELALAVREGKGRKQRLIPYGSNSDVLILVDEWLTHAGIENGFVFQRVLKDDKTVLPGRLSTVSIQNILRRYPIAVEGKLRHVKPHDLRRTYARLNYDASMDIVALKNNLGHKAIQTTEKYIGAMNAETRRPKQKLNFGI